MKNLTVIIPVFELDDDKSQLLLDAVNSVDDSKIVIIGPKADIDKITNMGPMKGDITTLVNDNDDTSYAYQAPHRPEPSAAGDGFMNIPDGIDEELPFN